MNIKEGKRNKLDYRPKLDTLRLGTNYMTV